MNKRKVILALIAVFVFIVPGGAFAQNNGDPFTVGLLIFDAPTFIDEMTALGYEQGVNVNYLTLSYEGIDFTQTDQMMEATRIQTEAMLNADVDLFVVNTDTDAVMLRQQTDAAIVFVISDDPVTTGAAENLTTPGNNMTGLVSNQHHQRRLQLLTEVDPSTQKVYYLYSSLALEGVTILEQVQALGEQLGVEVIPAPVADVQSGLEVLSNAPDDIDWLFLTPFLPFELPFYEAVLTTSTSHQAPVAYFVNTPLPGYLINYGPDLTVATRETARITDRIIRGANAGDLPVLVAENSLTVNLEAADAMGFEVPVAILRQADLIVRPGYFETLPGFGLVE